MSATGHLRGNPITYDPDAEVWRYTDGQPATTERPCVSCGLTAEPGGIDPCLPGPIEGLKAYCCGHGVSEAYGLTESGERWTA